MPFQLSSLNFEASTKFYCFLEMTKLQFYYCEVAVIVSFSGKLL